MGITFADLVEKSRTFEIDLGGKSLEITYDPSALSPAKISRLNKQLREVADSDDEDNDENLFAVAKMFCSVVKGWSLEGPFGEDEDGNPLIAAGKPVPVEAEFVAWLPSPIISHIIEKVGEDAAPKAKKRR